MSYDLVGNILTINDGLNLNGYSYDPMNRLVSATDYNLSYAYDLNGNRLTANSATGLDNYSYDPASNKLAAIQGTVVKNYQYDETGNTLSDGVHAYLYDGKNQLTDVTGVASYFYNGLGQRTAKNSNDTLTRYAYDENARLIGEYNATGQAIQETVYLFGQPVAVLKGTEVYNVHADHLGSPRKITSQAGSTVWQWQDKPFGDAPVNQDPDGNGIAFEYNLRFPGQYFDQETGLHYNWNRYYDPQTGRYITSDPIGLRGGLNTYGYVGGNPVNWIDPLGLYPGEETVNYVGGAMGGTGDFMQSYMDQQKATHFDDRSAPYHGWANQDKYFHCRANCEAAQRGNGGSDVAKCLSDIHEWGDQTWDGDSLADSAADQEANLYGREQGVADQGGNCQALCNKYRPSTLPGDY